MFVSLRSNQFQFIILMFIERHLANVETRNQMPKYKHLIIPIVFHINAELGNL